MRARRAAGEGEGGPRVHIGPVEAVVFVWTHGGGDKLEDILRWPSKRFDAVFAALIKQEARQAIEQQRQDMIAAGQWPKDKPLPDPEQFLTRPLLESTLKAMHYVPTKLDVLTR